jgi:glycine amidinotransferase
MRLPREPAPHVPGPVCSHNEWDPLEEVIVGVVDGASAPPWHITLQATMPRDQWGFFAAHGGRPFPQDAIDAANRELDALTRLLDAEGVIVQRPDRVDHSRAFATPDWTCGGGLYAAMPRDVMLVIGDQIIEAPMAWRSRYFEIHAYRALLKEYFLRGARWVAAPKPQLCDALYDHSYAARGDVHPPLVITELEPTFDAADFVRCGRDLFVQKSHVTNSFGIEWLRRHLGPGYTIHELQFNDPHPMHIDATFMPLAPGKLLVNPDRVHTVPDMFKTWEVLAAPPPSIPGGHTLYMSSKWVTMNLLMLDQERVIVEEHEELLIRALAGWGLKPIPCSFRSFNAFGGSFHCATLDVRRRGALESYF